jgi:hypothetical protein
MESSERVDAELCAPCSPLERLLERERVHDAVVHRRGLWAGVVEGEASECRRVDPAGQ